MCSVCTESKLRTYNSVDLLKKVETKTKYLFLKLNFFRLLQLTVLHFEMATFLRQFMCLHIVGGALGRRFPWPVLKALPEAHAPPHPLPPKSFALKGPSTNFKLQLLRNRNAALFMARYDISNSSDFC